MNDDFRPVARRLAWTWAALLVLMLASLGTSFLHLGAGNTLAGVGIAIVKAALVGWVFMNLSTAAPFVRLVAAVGIGVWLLLAGLSLVDFLPRRPDPAAYQSPRQIAPVIEQARH